MKGMTKERRTKRDERARLGILMTHQWSVVAWLSRAADEEQDPFAKLVTVALHEKAIKEHEAIAANLMRLSR